MTKQEKQLYDSAEAFKQLLWQTLAGKKFKLECGHHFSGGQSLGNAITIRNSAKGFKVVCSQCGYCGY